MSLPLVTRFGADPLLDLEVANKRYVDSLSFPAQYVIHGQEVNSLSTGTQNFAFSGNGTSATESARNNITSQTGTLSRLRMFMWANTRSVEGEFHCRVEQADTGLVVLIAAGLTGVFGDDVNTGAIVDNEQLGIQYRPNVGSGSFSLRGHSVSMLAS